MTNFWPSGLDLKDTSSPLEILQSANEEWIERSDGLLNLVIQEAESTNGNPLLIVHAKHVPSNRTVELFSVVHRPGATYPAKIQLRDEDLPEFLKKSYFSPSIASQAVMTVGEGRKITNERVCDTPAEFRRELEEVFNLGVIKSEVLSLVSGTVSSSKTDNGGN